MLCNGRQVKLLILRDQHFHSLFIIVQTSLTKGDFHFRDPLCSEVLPNAALIYSVKTFARKYFSYALKKANGYFQRFQRRASCSWLESKLVKLFGDA